MKSKIEKLKERTDMYFADSNSHLEYLGKRQVKIEDKINEIIDYLNDEDGGLTFRKEKLPETLEQRRSIEGYKEDGALAFYIELEDWLFGSGYVKNGEIKVPNKVFMQFVAKELKLNNKK